MKGKGPTTEQPHAGQFWRHSEKVQEIEKPNVRPGGLVTVAFLKAKLDEGTDRLSIFMPLVQDAVASLTDPTFTTANVQLALARLHDVVIPQHAIETLLRRALWKRDLKREHGRYSRTDDVPSLPSLAHEKAKIAESQSRLAKAFVMFATQRKIFLTEERALDLIGCFLDDQQIAVLLDESPAQNALCKLNHGDQTFVAEFLTLVVQHNADLSAVLRGMLEGLVLYHAAFIPDLEGGSRRFRDLTVYFDSDIVRQTLGYEGSARQIVLRETMKVFQNAGIRCLVFDNSVREIERILEFYESNLATTQGRTQLRQTEMDRHFLEEHYGPSDIRQLMTLLEFNISKEGFRIVSTPRRQARYVSEEAKLQKRLVNPKTKDEHAPRITHDVDCVAGILTLRKGHVSNIVEGSKFIFASSSFTVIRDIREWYVEDERGTGIPPIIHIQMLSNLAWLKNPKANSDLKQRELMSLCLSAMRPSEVTWQRFIRHLAKLEKEKTITSDEMAAIMVDSLSEDLLMRAQSYAPDGDVDADSIEDVIHRVRETYTKKYEDKLSIERQRLEAESKRADAAEKRTQDAELRVVDRAQRWSTWIARCTFGLWALGAIAGGMYLLIAGVRDKHFPGGLVGWGAVVFVIFSLLIDIDGRVRSGSHWISKLQQWLSRMLRRFFTV